MRWRQIRALRLLLASGMVAAMVVVVGNVPAAHAAVGNWSPIAAGPVLGGCCGDSPAGLTSDGRVLFVGPHSEHVRLYDPRSDSWALGAAPLEWEGPSTMLSDGRLIALDAYSSLVRFYDPATDVWSSANTFPGDVYRPSITNLPDGRLIVFGGHDNQPDWSTSVYLFDPATGTWSQASDMPVAVGYSPGLTLLDDGRLLVVGGQEAPFTTQVYDPTTDTWAVKAPTPVPRNQTDAVMLLDGRVLAVGGWYFDEPAAAVLYDPATDTWTDAGSTREPHTSGSATRLPDGRVLVEGGDALDGAWPNFAAVYTADLFDPVTNTWSAAADAGLPHGDRSTLLPDGTVFAYPERFHLAALPPAVAPEFEVAPLISTAPAKESLPVTVRVHDGPGGPPAVGAPVNISVVSGTNAGPVACDPNPCTTGPDGAVATTITRAIQTSEVLRAFRDNDMDGVLDAGESWSRFVRNWTARATRIEMPDAPARLSGFGVYGRATFRARLLDVSGGNVPVAGEMIVIAHTAPNWYYCTAVTNQNGYASCTIEFRWDSIATGNRVVASNPRLIGSYTYATSYAYASFVLGPDSARLP